MIILLGTQVYPFVLSNISIRGTIEKERQWNILFQQAEAPGIVSIILYIYIFIYIFMDIKIVKFL